MRIAFVAHGYPERETGGVELVAREQAEALAARGHRVAVFARTREDGLADGSTWDEEIDGVLVRRVVDNDPFGRSFAESYDHHRLDEPFARFLDEQTPEVVHVQHLVLLSPRLLDVARAVGIPCLLALHDFYFLCHRLFMIDNRGERCPGPDAGWRCSSCLEGLATPAEARERFAFMVRALTAAAAVVAPSPSLARRFAAEWPALRERIRIIEPGLVHCPRRIPSRRYGKGLCGDPLRVVFVGTWLPHKGLDLLVDAVCALDGERISLAIYGAGIEGSEVWIEALRQRAQGAPIRWCGAFAASQLEAVLAEADVLALPSRCDESYSRVVREARAAGLAVIAPATGGPADLLRDGVDALLVPPGDGEALRQVLARLVADPALVERLATAPATLRTVAEAVRELEELYREIRGGGIEGLR